MTGPAEKMLYIFKAQNSISEDIQWHVHPRIFFYYLLLGECFRQTSPCQWMHDLSRGHTTAESAAVTQTKAECYYLQRALTTQLQLFKEWLILSREWCQCHEQLNSTLIVIVSSFTGAQLHAHLVLHSLTAMLQSRCVDFIHVSDTWNRIKIILLSYFCLLSLPQRVPPSPIDQAPHQLQSSSQGTRWESEI